MSLILVSPFHTYQLKKKNDSGRDYEEFMETFNAFQMQNWLKFSYVRRWNVMVIITDLFKNILWKSPAFISGERWTAERTQ